MNTIKLNKDGSNVKMVAHRGVSGLERENTCAAFVAAGNRETYFGIETDVHRTADGKFVIIHDSNTQRVAGVDMIVEETTMDVLRTLRLTDRMGNTRGDLVLPTLEEYLSICKYYGKNAVLELKNAMSEADIRGIMDVIESMDYAENVTIISFWLENLVLLRKNYPNQRAQYLLGECKPEDIETLKKYSLSLDIAYIYLTPEIVEQVHEAGLEVNCWTVDDPKEAARMISYGVDYITSNILE